jgi:hypothetical protein
MYIPYAWQTMQTLEARVQAHAEAIATDFAHALQELDTRRQEAGLKKTLT